VGGADLEERPVCVACCCFWSEAPEINGLGWENCASSIV
jgi:hypothetical protein